MLAAERQRNHRLFRDSQAGSGSADCYEVGFVLLSFGAHIHGAAHRLEGIDRDGELAFDLLAEFGPGIVSTEWVELAIGRSVMNYAAFHAFDIVVVEILE